MHSKVIMRAVLLLTGLPAWIACATAGTPPVACPPLALDVHTVRIEGWFAAHADWKVNSLRGYENFNPFGKEEDQRCVTIVNDTGEPAEDFAGFDDKQVIVTGFALKYDDLPVGETVADQVMTLRYYKGEQVHNFCLRQWVFVANKIVLKD